MTIKTDRNKCQPGRLIRLIIIIMLGFTTNAYAESKEKTTGTQSKQFLTVNPERCVALRQGQICYQRVVFKWQTKDINDYCLFPDGQTTPLQCWNKVSSGRFNMDFQAAESRRYILRQKNQTVDIASAELIVAWVYGNKKRRRASWRLF